MKKLNPRDPEDIKAIGAIIERIRHDWDNEPNVVQIGPGIKVKNRKPLIDILSIQFFVDRKVDEAECRARDWKVIPDEIDNIPTDVEPTQQKPLQILETRRQRFDPLIGGIVIGNQQLTSVGTLGGIVFMDNADRTPVGLTNEHVLVFTNEGTTGDPVVQPWRDYDSDVSVVDADCCPDGQLSFDDVPNPLAGVLAATAAAAAIAAVASDVIDPHRRGQENTNVAPGERTVKEHVYMKVSYPELPLPGTRYSTEVTWDYTRHTNIGAHGYSVVKEKPSNPHVLREQELVTNKTTYPQGEVVYYLAAIGVPDRRRDCPEQHVVAHAISPSDSHRQSTILRPLRPGDIKDLSRHFQQLDLTRPLMPQFLYFGDYDWRNAPPYGVARFEHRGFEVVGISGNLLRFTDAIPRPVPDGIGELSIPAEGIEIRLPAGAEFALALVHGRSSVPITLTAYDGEKEVGAHSGGGDDVAAYLQVSAPRITRVTLTGGGGEGMLMLLASARTLSGIACYYWGRTHLAPTAELGLWFTYLIVQTTNDVPDGTDPAKAAQIIGGLISSHNLASGGRRSQLPFGEFCAIDAIADGNFKVVPPM